MRRPVGFVASALISWLLVASILLILGFGGRGLEVEVHTDREYHPHSVGTVSMYLTNGWWTRDIHLDQISLYIDDIQKYDWQIENLVSSIPPGKAVNVSATLTVLEHNYGVFEFAITVQFKQSVMFWFGSEEANFIIYGNITISP